MKNLDKILAPYKNKEVITVWTIHDLPAWKEFQRQGIIKADGRKISNKDYRKPYQWMISQMKKKIPGSSGYPIWAWYYPKPDLRQIALLPSKTKGVLLECRVPSQRVLLSDIDGWSIVVNNGYLPLTEEDDKTWDKTRDELEAGNDILQIQELLEDTWHRVYDLKENLEPQINWPKIQSIIESTWPRIFDLFSINRSCYLGKIDRIQATIPFIKLEEVVKVREFIAR